VTAGAKRPAVIPRAAGPRDPFRVEEFLEEGSAVAVALGTTGS